MLPTHLGYYRGEWYTLCICGVLVMGGLRALWSSFGPLDEYTRRLRGEQPLWGRALGILIGVLFTVAGLAGLGLILLGEGSRHWSQYWN